jgi:hypothetical protein
MCQKSCKGQQRAKVVALFSTLILMVPVSLHAANSVTLAWGSSTSVGVTGYNLYYGTSSQTYDKAIPAGTATQATVSDLQPGTTYYFASTAYDSAGNESEFSNEVVFSAPTTNSPPAPNPGTGFPPRASYFGLFYEPKEINQPSSGSFTVSTTGRGSYSGGLVLAGARYRFTGKMDSQGQATNTIARRIGGPLTLELNMGNGESFDEISGRLTDGTWVAVLSGDRSTFNARTNPTSAAGSYTMVIPGTDGDALAPHGDGFGAVRVSAGGLATFAGTFADGTKVTQSAQLSKQNTWPFYASLNSSKGSAISWLTLHPSANTNSDVAGLLNWTKVADPVARYYPAGFTNQHDAIGSVYERPAVGSPILNLDNASVVISDGMVGSLFTNVVTLAANNRILNQSSNRLSLTFSVTTGTFRGSVTDPTTKLSSSFSGAVLQNLNAGFGTLLTTNQSRRVDFLSPSAAD